MGCRSSAKGLKKLFCLVAFVVLTLACADVHTHTRLLLKRPTPAQVQVSKLYHADIRFNKTEQRLITEAVMRINEQTNGVASLGVIFDLDWEDKDVLNIHSRDDLVISTRADSTAVKKVDEKMRKGNVSLGWCDVMWDDPSYATRVYLVVDRLETEQKYVHVVMHEMLHSLRLQHIAGKRYSVMYWQTQGPEPTVCMSHFDAEELCRVYRCKVEEISYCE